MAPELLDRAMELQRKCWTHEKIAAELGVSRVTITRNLNRYNRRLMARMRRRDASEKARQLEQLRWIAQEAAEAWERSKQPIASTKTTEEGVGTADDGTTVLESKTETTVKEQGGIPAFLAEARAAMADARRILGLDAPAKTEATGPGPTVNVQVVNATAVLKQLPDTDLAALERIAGTLALDTPAGEG